MEDSSAGEDCDGDLLRDTVTVVVGHEVAAPSGEASANQLPPFSSYENPPTWFWQQLATAGSLGAAANVVVFICIAESQNLEAAVVGCQGMLADR